MSVFAKPRVVVSKCLGFAACRYDGQIIRDSFIEKLKAYVDFITVCPEVAIGLGIPRDPIRLVSLNGEIKLLQPSTGQDFSSKMHDFVNSFLLSLEKIDGFILKNHSPSCGIKDIKVYSGLVKAPVIGKKGGFLGEKIAKEYGLLAVEEEKRLTNPRIREHFLIKLFTLAQFRETAQLNSLSELVKFHSTNKYLLMAYNEKEMRVLGKIIANNKKQALDNIIKEYNKHLNFVFAKIPRYTSNINVLMHIMGYFSKSLSFEEKSFLLNSIEKYRNNLVPLSVPLNLLKAHAIRFDEKYLLEQTIFQPYPEEIIG